MLVPGARHREPAVPAKTAPRRLAESRMSVPNKLNPLDTSTWAPHKRAIKSLAPTSLGLTRDLLLMWPARRRARRMRCLSPPSLTWLPGVPCPRRAARPVRLCLMFDPECFNLASVTPSWIHEQRGVTEGFRPSTSWQGGGTPLSLSPTCWQSSTWWRCAESSHHQLTGGTPATIGTWRERRQESSPPCAIDK